MFAIPPPFCKQAGIDPYFANVSALLHFNGSNGSTSIVDSGPDGRTFSCTGTAALTTAQARYGSAALNPGTGGVTSVNNAAFLMGAGAMTFEASVYKTADAAGEHCVGAVWGAGGYSWFVGIGSSGTLHFYLSTNGSGGTHFLGGGTVPNTGWSELCVAIEPYVGSPNVYGFINGVFVFGGTLATGLFASTLDLGVGRDSDGINTLGFIVDEVRITKGVARHITGYTPTGPFSDS